MTDRVLRVRITTRSTPIPRRVAEVLDAFDRHGSIGRTFAKIVRQALEEDGAPTIERDAPTEGDASELLRDVEAEFARWMCAPATHEAMGGVCANCARRLSILSRASDVLRFRGPAYRTGRMHADRSTLGIIPERYRVSPSSEGPSAYAIAVGASVLALLDAITRAEDELRRRTEALAAERLDLIKERDEARALASASAAARSDERKLCANRLDAMATTETITAERAKASAAAFADLAWFSNQERERAGRALLKADVLRFAAEELRGTEWTSR